VGSVGLGFGLVLGPAELGLGIYAGFSSTARGDVVSIWLKNANRTMTSIVSHYLLPRRRAHLYMYVWYIRDDILGTMCCQLYYWPLLCVQTSQFFRACCVRVRPWPGPALAALIGYIHPEISIAV